jgi:GTPase
LFLLVLISSFVLVYFNILSFLNIEFNIPYNLLCFYLISIMASEKKSTRRRVSPIDSTGYEELCIAMVGSVDSSKSSTIGTLTTGILDDGKGLSRSSVFVHPHEHETGRTSDISYQYYVDEESKRIISFVDLAGHAMYLKTTVSGLSASYPDLAFVCVSDKITPMTREHISLCITMEIPFVVLFTKVDMVPIEITTALISDLAKKLVSLKLSPYRMSKPEDLDLFTERSFNGTTVPLVLTSNKTGEGLDLVKYIMTKFPKRIHIIPDGFAVEHIYNVQGIGTVVSGMVGEKIFKGDTLYMGPFQQGNFINVTVRSIHNDYRFDQEFIEPGKRGCLCIALPARTKRQSVQIRKGMILSKSVPNNICKRFIAKLKVFQHHTTVGKNYQGFINAGMLKEAVKFIRLTDHNNVEIESLKGNPEVFVEMEFVKHLNYVTVGQTVVFREGNVRGVGRVTSIIQQI